MMRIKAIFKRILLQRLRDKRSLALLFFAPLGIISLLYFLLQVPSDIKYRVGLQENQPVLAQVLKQNEKLKVIEIEETLNTREIVNTHNLDALIQLVGNEIEVTYANRDTSKTQALTQMIGQIAQKIPASMRENQAKSSAEKVPQDSLETLALNIKSHYLYGDSSLSMFDNLAPLLVSFFVFFFVFLISGISLVNERSSGTLMRMLVTPVRRTEIVAGYTLAYGFLALLQTSLIVLWTRYVLQMQILGNFILVLLINLLIALIALLIGLLLSALAKTEFQFIQFVPIAVVPQFLFSGIINVDTMAAPLRWIAHLMPLYYGVDALQKVVKQGEGFSQIGNNLFILGLLALVLYVANVVALKGLRKT
ncbi:antibiotic transport system permease [Lactococcus garvieae]|nr:hypothetical protein [Lactococcus petauri]MDC7843957.1 hypothetical protein [Lactococcus petauri]MDC7845808.1 hypothetical protein [Lactococcus petauri]OAL07866.1 antibiotic transport system permease [Lactococcus garvieae]UQU61181.1 hypothetical protein lgb_01977 [Lactococcus petauri]